MRPHEKGWLTEYLESRKGALRNLVMESRNKRSHPEHSLYRIIQPTGLMYGQVVGEIDYPGQEGWNQKDKMKVLLTESLLSSSLLYYDKPVNTTEDISGVILHTFDKIGNFYNNIFPELATPTKTLWGRKKSPLELAEKILDKRIEHTTEYQENFWTSFFHNSLLFLDVFIFGQWIHTNADNIVADFFRYEREELRFSVAKVIAAASHANKDVVYEERKLFEFFISSTNLSGEKRKEAIKIFDEGIAVQDINLPSENSWILKKYFLEVAILTFWADKRVEQTEIDFLKKLCSYLDFNEDDLENSLIAIEGFVLEHWEKLDYLQNKKDFDQVSEQYIQRLARVADKNKSRLSTEIRGNAEMVNLLKKGRSHELSSEEKERMRHHLLQALKTIPTFVITSLPQKFLTLPVLLKILPKNLFVNEG